MPDGKTSVVPFLDVEEKVREAWSKGFQVIVWNDPVNLMTYVTHVFQKVFGWNLEKAQKHMLEVHENGKSAVASETREVAEHYVHLLHQYGLTATMESVG